MPRTQNHKWVSRNFSGGLVYNVAAQIASLITDSTFIEAQNMRLSGINSTQIALTKIKGEQLLWPLIGNAPVDVTGFPQASNLSQLADTYVCVGACSCNGYIFEIWADSAPASPQPSFVRINGLIVLYSDDFLANAFNYFNTHTNQSAAGGLVAATDNFNPPYIFNIIDLLNNAGVDYLTGKVDHLDFPPTQNYFTDFKLALITQTLSNQCDHPVFVEIASALPPGSIQLGSGGLTNGLYIYSTQLVTVAGDTNNFSAPTPPIPVPTNLSATQTAYPFGKTYGGPAGSLTTYGIHFRFRVTNPFGIYAFVNILRVAYNNGFAPNTNAPYDIIASLPISEGFSIMDCFDFGATASSTITTLETSETLSVLKRAASNRFFGRRLYYGGPTYESKDLNSVAFLDAGNIPCYAITENLGLASHKHPYNFTYFRHYQLGEQYAYGAVFFDETFSQTFVTPVPVPNNTIAYPNKNPAFPAGFEFPNRRDQEQQTGVGSTLAASTQNVNGDTTIGNTYEVFDLSQATAKNDGAVNAAELNVSMGLGFYAPFKPIDDSDPNTYLWNYNPTTTAYVDSGTPVGYAPQMFNLNYYATGLAIKGIDTNTIPPFIGGFSVVRSERANRVICQGLAFYDYNSHTSPASKGLNSFIFYSPDVETGMVDFQNIINNLGSGRYAVQFVSPLGFATEIYGVFNGGVTGIGGDNIDMISYARVLRETGLINPGDTTGTNGINGYTAYGRWRSQTSSTTQFNIGSLGNTLFTIPNGGIVERTNPITIEFPGNSGRQTLYEITLNSGVNIYGQGSVPTITIGDWFNNSSGRSWNEPIYIVNIIDTAAGLPQNQDFNTYIDAGTFIKTQSIIGTGTGTTIQNFLLVDERAADATNNFISGSSWTLGQYFVTVKDLSGNPKKWIDITEPFNTANAGQLTSAYNAIIANTYAGAYIVTSNNYDSTNPLSVEYTIQFNAGLFSSIGQATTPVPTNGYQVIVTYNNNSPIEVFGGDTQVNESVYALYDSIATGGLNANDLDVFFGVPYDQYLINANMFIVDLHGVIQTQNVQPVSIRQWIMMFTAESKTMLGYNFCAAAPDYQDRMFPNVHYIMKPMGLSGGESATTFVIMPDYGNDYPDMVDGSGNFTPEITYGGFRFKQSLISTNIDYVHESDQFVYFSKSNIISVDQNTYSDRIIWSDQSVPNLQDAPGFQTFPPSNFFDLSEDTGGINFLWDAYTRKGSNLYAFTDSGICLAVTNQFITTQNTGDPALVINDGSNNGVLQEVWISKTVGLPFQMWRSAAENNNTLFFTNNQSSYKLVENEVVDIARQKYFLRVYGDVLSNQDGRNDVGIASVFDTGTNEYWVGFKQHSLTVNTTDLLNAGITNNYSYYNVTIPLIGEPIIAVDVIIGSVFYITNNSGTPLFLVDSTSGDVLFTAQTRQTYIVKFSGVYTYTVVQIPTNYSYEVPFSGGTIVSIAVVYDGASTGYTPPLPVAWTCPNDIVDILNAHLNFSGTVTWYVWGTYFVAITDHVLGEIDIFNGIFTLVIDPTILIQFPFSATTFSYLDETTITIPKSGVDGTRMSWNGIYTYDYDKYVTVNNIVYGMKAGGTYIVGQSGYTLNDAPMVGSVVQATAGDAEDGSVVKQLLKVRIDNDLLAPSLPTRVEFYDSLDDYRAGVIQCFLDTSIYPTALKPYYGWEGWVPRRNTGLGADLQNNLFLYNIVHNTATPFFVTLTSVQYKRLR